MRTRLSFESDVLDLNGVKLPIPSTFEPFVDQLRNGSLNVGQSSTSSKTVVIVETVRVHEHSTSNDIFKCKSPRFAIADGFVQIGATSDGILECRSTSASNDAFFPRPYGSQIKRTGNLRCLSFSPRSIMTSVIASAAQAAHSVAASLLANAQIQPGASIPAADVKEDAPDQPKPLVLTGKNIIVSICSGYLRVDHSTDPLYMFA